MKPRLIHPQRVTLKNVDFAHTSYDDVFMEAEEKVLYSAPFTFDAQVSFGSYKDAQARPYGWNEYGSGHLTVLPKTAERIAKGARITVINGRAVEYYVHDIEPMGHYEGATLWKIHFRSKDHNDGA